MEEYKIILELLKNQTGAGLLLGFILWEKYIYPKWKKSRGTYVSWKDIDEKLLAISMRIADIENKIIHHLEKEQEEDIKIAIMTEKLENLEGLSTRNEEHIEKIFDMITQLKNTWMEGKKKK